jgi:hypothetical protein
MLRTRGVLRMLGMLGMRGMLGMSGMLGMLGMLGVLPLVGFFRRLQDVGRLRRLRRLRRLGELSGSSGRRRRFGDRRDRSSDLAGRRGLGLRLRLQRNLPAAGGVLRSSACLGRRCIDTRGRGPGSGRRRRGGIRRRDRPVMRLVDNRAVVRPVAGRR